MPTPLLKDNLKNIPVSARRTESLDAPGITKLANKQTCEIFGRVNVAFIIEMANLGITLVDDSGSIVGHAAFYDAPNWILNDTKTWTEWMRKNFVADQYTPINTLFLHYFVCKEEFSDGTINEILRTVYHAVPLLQFVCLVVPVNHDIGKTLSAVFNLVQHQTGTSPDYQIFSCQRHEYCPILHIREARIEDHDDLMPIFNKHNNHLNDIYGEFFLAELIEAQDEGNKCIVADVNGTAVGFVNISTDINTDILKENFELKVFNYFLKKIERKKKVMKEKPRESSSRNESPLKDNDLKSGTADSEGQRKSPLRSPRKRVTKLSSVHLEESEKDLGAASKTPEVEYITESFDVESLFCIQLFCIDDRYESRSADFLSKMFEVFPDKEFAVITVPHTVPEFPLLQTFQRVPPKPESVFGHELYLFNKNGLLKSFNVRLCKQNDVSSIRSLTETIKGHKNIMQDVEQYNNYRRDHDGTRIHAYVAEVLGQVIGVCIFRDELETSYMRSHYNIEDFVYFRLHAQHQHGRLHHFVLNPIFQHYSKSFIKEVLYLSQKSNLYYPLYPDLITHLEEKPYSLVTCLKDLVPVRSRRQIVYPLKDLEENAPTQDVIEEKEPYALYHINRKLTLEPKVVINLRIVVVGSSTVGLSTLQTFVFCPHLIFNNLVLVSDDEVFNIDATPDDLSNAFLPQNVDYNSKQKHLQSLPTWVNFVKGKMTGIDRKNKLLIVDESQTVPYDQLLLCTGQQFHLAVPTDADVEKLTTTSEALKTKPPSVHTGFTPENVFTLNTQNDCVKIKEWIENSFDKDNIIVYGDTLEAYNCIHGLLKYGVKGNCIHHVHPPSSPPTAFNSSYIENAMKKELNRFDVNSYYGYTLARWNDNQKDDKQLKMASFTSDSKPLTVSCQAFICCHKKTVDYNAFKAINDSCLVYDGKLVIDTSFRTNDPSIRSAGPLTKFARRYHSENWTHANFSSKEVGSKLAESVLELFDPTLDVIEDMNVEKERKLIPKYKQPVVELSCLPGDYTYFNVRKPAIPIALELQKTQPDYGIDIITGDNLNDEGQGYFRIHINLYDTVQDITCLSKKVIDYTNLLCLYGFHEKYLNNLMQRYKDGLITDLYTYFKEPWCLAIYHDRFKDFRSEIRDIFATPDEAENVSLEEKVRQLILEDASLREEQKQHLHEMFVGTHCKDNIRDRLNSFLNYNKYHLPMFARPGIL